jgi:hypothetical protein
MHASPVLLAAATTFAQFCCLPPAVGADSGLYVGASGGVAVPDVDASTVDERLKALGFASSSTSTGEHATAFKVFVGYRLSRYFGVEVGYSPGRVQLQVDVTRPEH